MSRHRWLLALCAWTFVVWTFRIGTIWDDAGASTAGKVARTALALSFTVLASVAVVAALRGRVPRSLVVAFTGWTIVVWIVRAVGIAGAGHGAAFVAVHLVLAAISIALAVLALRAPDREPAQAAS